MLTLVVALGASKDAKIFGGENCDVSRYPFYIYIEGYSDKINYICGGSLLTPNSVLTAGHCCYGMESAVLFSGYDRMKKKFDQKLNAVVPAMIHPNFSMDSLVNDVCIIKVSKEKPFKLTKRTRLVRLTPRGKLKEMMENNEEKHVYELQLMGYGINKKRNDSFLIDPTLPFQCTTSLLTTQRNCSVGMTNVVYDKSSMFCHYNPIIDTVKGSCKGDSGSPILYADMQVGLISWGPNEEVCTKRMEVSARLDTLYNWITKNSA